jgi:predicted DCC family thiol-disulfide oxidoreductase YuxK
MSIILFDGVCNLCNASVQWVLKHDHKNLFHFAALQSEYGALVLKRFGLEPGALDTVVLADETRVFTQSDAAIEVARRLGGFWALMVVFKVVPRPIRNAVYRWVSSNRYRWFGRQEKCLLPRPEWKDKFLSA